MKRLFLATGEASGDALGAALVAVLRDRHPQLEVRGAPGPRLRAAGVTGVPAEQLTAVGLVEAAWRAPWIARSVAALARDVDRFDPEVVVTVDSPGALLRLQGRLAGRRRLHWVAPQVWAWRPGRAARVSDAVDTLCCLLPFEPAWFDDRVRAVFTGHPAATAWDAGRAPEPTLALLPGSRPTEVARLWPVLRDVAAEVAARVPGLRIRVAVAPTVDPGSLGGLDATPCDGVRSALTGAWAAAVCSGTATLEVAAAGVPQVVVYRVHPATWAVGRAVVRGVDHLALPNVLAGEAIAPEHLQDLRPDAIAADLVAAMSPGSDQVARLRPWLEGLAPDGAVERVADEVERLAIRR